MLESFNFQNMLFLVQLAYQSRLNRALVHTTVLTFFKEYWEKINNFLLLWIYTDPVKKTLTNANLNSRIKKRNIYGFALFQVAFVFALKSYHTLQINHTKLRIKCWWKRNLHFKMNLRMNSKRQELRRLSKLFSNMIV